MLNSCFSHAIAIAEGKFLSRLTLPSKKNSLCAEILITTLASDEASPGEVDPKMETEDTEEEIQELTRLVQAATADVPHKSDNSQKFLPNSY